MSLNHNDKIVITGGAGFLGSFVIERLQSQGYTNVESLRKKDFDLTHEAEVDRLFRLIDDVAGDKNVRDVRLHEFNDSYRMRISLRPHQSAQMLREISGHRPTISRNTNKAAEP